MANEPYQSQGQFPGLTSLKEEKKKEPTKQVFLTKKSLSSDEHFRIFIPKEVESKFRTLCELSPELEWSGVLFYTIMGSFEDKNLEVHCKDFFLMDQGTKVNTEINYNTPEIAAYMAQNLELLDCYQGLCHSHNTMPKSFC